MDPAKPAANLRIQQGVPADLAEALTRDVEAQASAALSLRGVFTLALSGGSVATGCYPRLAASRVDWARTHVFWADERAVPSSDPESNYGAAKALLLTPADVPAANVHPMPADAADLAHAATEYADLLWRWAASETPVPSLDVVILGVGPDGHVASLFPGHRLLEERDRFVATLDDSPKPPPRRMTLTLPVLQQAGRVIVAAFGASKAEVLHDALDNPSSALPLARVIRGARGSVLCLVDAEAGRLVRVR